MYSAGVGFSVERVVVSSAVTLSLIPFTPIADSRIGWVRATSRRGSGGVDCLARTGIAGATGVAAASTAWGFDAGKRPSLTELVRWGGLRREKANSRWSVSKPVDSSPLSVGRLASPS